MKVLRRSRNSCLVSLWDNLGCLEEYVLMRICFCLTRKKHAFISRAIRRIITTLDACPGPGRLNQLNVVFVANALATLRVSATTGAATRIVLASVV